VTFGLTQLTIPAMMTLLAFFTVKYHLSGAPVVHLLTLISLTLPTGHNLPFMLKVFKAYLRSLNSPVNIHYFCSVCFVPVKDRNITLCPNSACLQDLRLKGARSYFNYFPIAEQLHCFSTLFFKRPGIYLSLQHRFEKNKKNVQTSRIFMMVDFPKIQSEAIIFPIILSVV